MISAIVLVECFGMAAWMIHLLYKYELVESAARHSALADWCSMIQKKDERIERMDADYKALVESYLRETGKVYVRPAMMVGEKLQPAQPSPWRFQPPPPIPQSRPKAGK